jgi:hypothetical protein
MRETSPRRVHEGRLPAMRALFAVVVDKLRPCFADRHGKAATVAGVSEAIKQTTGLGMSTHGFSTDAKNGFAAFSAKQVWSYRLWFKGGLAYQVPWCLGEGSGKPQLANSAHGYAAVIRKDPGSRSGAKPGRLVPLYHDNVPIHLHGEARFRCDTQAEQLLPFLV